MHEGSLHHELAHVRREWREIEPQICTCQAVPADELALRTIETCIADRGAALKVRFCAEAQGSLPGKRAGPDAHGSLEPRLRKRERHVFRAHLQLTLER